MPRQASVERHVIDQVARLRETSRVIAQSYRYDGDEHTAGAVEDAMSRIASSACVLAAAAATMGTTREREHGKN